MIKTKGLLFMAVFLTVSPSLIAPFRGKKESRGLALRVGWADLSRRGESFDSPTPGPASNVNRKSGPGTFPPSSLMRSSSAIITRPQTAPTGKRREEDPSKGRGKPLLGILTQDPKKGSGPFAAPSVRYQDLLSRDLGRAISKREELLKGIDQSTPESTRGSTPAENYLRKISQERIKELDPEIALYQEKIQERDQARKQFGEPGSYEWRKKNARYISPEGKMGGFYDQEEES